LNTDKIRVCVLAEAEIGGTGKAATIYAAELISRGYEVDYLAAEGPRSAFLKSRGVRSLDPGKSDTDLYDYMTRYRPQVIHQHVPGYPTDNRLYRALRRVHFGKRPKIIETNVFGRLEDPEGDDLIDFRMFVSMASAAQSFQRAGIKDPMAFLNRHTVLYNPVLPAKRMELTERRQFRSQLGVTDDNVLVVRVGRPGHKWNSWECKAHASARKDVPQLCLFLMEPPTWLTRKIEQGKFGRGIIVHRETSEFDWLDQVYASADVMIHASDWGESFGYTIAEGMVAGLPVITRSTPWGDNAQVELVNNDRTGFVCWSVPEMARRLVELGQDSVLRVKMGSAGAKRIVELSDIKNETDILEEVIHHVLGDRPLSKIKTRNEELTEFCRKFPARERATSVRSPLSFTDFASASIYRTYRCARSGARAVIDRIKRHQVGWHPHQDGAPRLGKRPRLIPFSTDA
jgi:glycosyltransferase involved in cell wall biosynthesis